MKKAYIKLTRTQQRDLLILDVIFSLTVIFLINIYWEPIIFMVFTAYIILNKDHALTALELFALFGIVTPLLSYSVLARFLSMAGGLMITVPWVFIVTLIYLFGWRKTR